METFFTLLALCVGNSPVTGEFPTQRPVTRSFGVFFDVSLDKRLSKQSRGWWFETPSCSLWRHYNVPGNGHQHWWRYTDLKKGILLCDFTGHANHRFACRRVTSLSVDILCTRDKLGNSVIFNKNTWDCQYICINKKYDWWKQNVELKLIWLIVSSSSRRHIRLQNIYQIPRDCQ